MTSIIRTSNGKSIALRDGETNRVFSIGLVGELATDYDATIAQNLYQMCENFASDKPPELNLFVNRAEGNGNSASVTPLVGQLWYDTTSDFLKVYDTSGKWTSVGKEFTEGNFVPLRDSTLDIGESDSYWHHYYGIHITANTNRFFGQVGVADPDGIPAMTINGDSILQNTVKAGSISCSSGVKGHLGDFSTPIDTINVDQLLMGKHTQVGLQADSVYPNHIVPSRSSNVEVSFGSRTETFKSIYASDIVVEEIGSVTANISFRADEILSGNNVNVGSATHKIPHIHAVNLEVEYISTLPNENFSAASDVTLGIYKKAIRQMPTRSAEYADKVQVLGANDVIKKVPYVDIIPNGFMMMWSGASLPQGWKLCDGKSYLNGQETTSTGTDVISTPDMSELFCYGAADGESPSKQGSVTVTSNRKFQSNGETEYAGEHNHEGDTEEHVLELDEIPAHEHEYELFRSGKKSDAGDTLGKVGTGERSFSGTGGNAGHIHAIDKVSTKHRHSVKETTDHVHTFEPWKSNTYSMAYIMKVQ